MSLIKRCILTVLLLLTKSLLFAENYYVSPNGNNSNTGTMQNPFATIQKAHDVAQPGDTIYVREGTYSPSAQTKFSKDGTANSYIVLRSYPGEIPLIDGENIPDGNINHGSTTTWSFSGAKYWKIIGPITLTNGRGAGIYIGGSQFLEFDQVESCYNGKRASRAAHGFMIWTGSDILFKNCDAHHNANHLWKSTETPELNQYQHGDGWRIFAGTRNIKFLGCRSWRNLDDNYDFYGADNPIELVDCWAAYAGIDDSLGSITGIPNMAVPFVEGRGSLWGNGIKLGYNEDNVTHQVIRCLTWKNNAAGFHTNQGPSRIVNTASYGNRAFGFDYEDGNKHEILNCWEFDNNYNNPDNPGVTPDLSLCNHNSWDNTIDIVVSIGDFITVDDAGMLGQRLTDGSLPATSFLRLVSGSDLIDAGMDVELPFLGVAPDIGAFEFDNETTYLAEENRPVLPEKFNLTNYPNPFNPITVVQFNLPRAGNVEVVVYDITGRKVIQLDSGYRTAGTHTLSWNATDDNGLQVSSGVYLLSVQTGKHVETIKMTYMR